MDWNSNMLVYLGLVNLERTVPGEANCGYGIRSRGKNNIPTPTRDLYRYKIGPIVLSRPSVQMCHVLNI
jgi:hypothetical protein